MSLAWPWCFLALPLPWLLRLWRKPAAAGAALRLPTLPLAEDTDAVGRTGWPLWVAGLAWILLLFAAARPQLPEPGPGQPASGRELMLAFDVSASMASTDLSLAGKPVDRLAAARLFAGDFLAKRQGDRVGLVVFGRQSYLHTPLTFDLEAVRAALDSVEVGLAGRETAIGDAIALATRHLRELPGSERVLVLVTDGANTAGTLTPARGAWLARREGVRIHAVGIGSGADLDEAGLREIAEQSGGSYQRVTDGAAMAAFWQRLDVLEASAPAGRRPPRELYAWPLGLALMLVAVLAWRHGSEAA